MTTSWMLADLHIASNPSFRFFGTDPRSHLERAVGYIRKHGDVQDKIIVAGDISHDDSPSSYSFAAAVLGDAGFPVFAVPGNHDKLHYHVSEFALGLPYRLDVSEDWQMHLFDSRGANNSPGDLSDLSMEYLRTKLVPGKKHALVFHHDLVQPLPPGRVGFGERLPQVLDQVRDATRDSVLFVTGHRHQYFACRVSTLSFINLGAVSAQLSFSGSSPTLASGVPELVAIEWMPNSYMHTRIRLVEGAES